MDSNILTHNTIANHIQVGWFWFCWIDLCTFLMEGEVKCLKLIPKRNRLFHNCKSW